jgi:hypothetical protein
MPHFSVQGITDAEVVLSRRTSSHLARVSVDGDGVDACTSDGVTSGGRALIFLRTLRK